MLKSFITIGSFTFLSRLTGLAREVLMTYLLGVSALTDTFFVAFKLPNFFRRIFAEGAFNSAFVPLFSGKLSTEGKDEALEFASRVYSVLFITLCLFVALVLIFTPTFIQLVAPGFAHRPEQMEMAITFTRLTFPYILFISLAAHLSGVLNSFEHFVAAAAVPILLNVVMILALLAASSLNLPYGLVLSFSVPLAGMAQLGWLYWCCCRRGIYVRFLPPRLTPDVKLLIKRIIPGAIGAGFMNINFLLDTVLASFLPPKSISYIYIADRLHQLPLALFGIAIGTALLPILSKKIQQGQYEEAHKDKTFATNFAIQLTIPGALGLCAMSIPLIQCIYRTLSPEDVLAVTRALQAFALGIPAYVLNKVLVTGFFARGDTKTPVKVATFCILVNLSTSLSLMGSMGHVALALAVTVSGWVNALLLYLLLRKRKWFYLDRTIYKTLGFVTAHSLIMVWTLFKLTPHLEFMGRSFWADSLRVTLLGCTGIFIVFSLGVLCKTFQWRDMNPWLK